MKFRISFSSWDLSISDLSCASSYQAYAAAGETLITYNQAHLDSYTYLYSKTATEGSLDLPVKNAADATALWSDQGYLPGHFSSRVPVASQSDTACYDPDAFDSSLFLQHYELAVGGTPFNIDFSPLLAVSNTNCHFTRMILDVTYTSN